MLIVCYNSTLDSSTGFIPYVLFSFRSPVFPVEGVICSVNHWVPDNVDEYVKQQKDKHLTCFDIALQYMSDTFLYRKGQFIITQVVLESF